MSSWGTAADVHRLREELRGMQERIAALERAVDGIARHVGWTPPPEPDVPPLPPEVLARLARGDRPGAVQALAVARGVSLHLATRELDERGA